MSTLELLAVLTIVSATTAATVSMTAEVQKELEAYNEIQKQIYQHKD